MKLHDRFGRPIENLRIQITTRCNYSCVFCHHEGYYHCRKGYEELSLDAVHLIAKVAKEFEITQVKITGGEPLLHKDVVEIIRVLAEMKFEDISLVTNGYFLPEYAQKLYDAGLNRINVSLPSLSPEKYSYVTQMPKKAFEKTLNGIKKAVAVGLNPVKVNVVILKDINNDEWMNFIDFAQKNNVVIQFIEYHSSDPNSLDFKKFYTPIDAIESYLKRNARKVIIRNMHHRRRYILESGVEVEVVRPMFNSEFCANCRRIRATPIGWKPCLLRDIVVDFTHALRTHSLEEMISTFLKAVELREPFFK